MNLASAIAADAQQLSQKCDLNQTQSLSNENPENIIQATSLSDARYSHSLTPGKTSLSALEQTHLPLLSH